MHEKQIFSSHSNKLTQQDPGFEIAPGCILLQRFTNHTHGTSNLAWSFDGHILAFVIDGGIVSLWNVNTGELYRSLSGHIIPVRNIAWSPVEYILASGSDDSTIRLWDVETGTLRSTLSGHAQAIKSLVWSPDGRILASGSDDLTIRLWDVETGYTTNILEGHTDAVVSLSFSFNSTLLASCSYSSRSVSSVRIWRCNTWESVVDFSGLAGGEAVAFHPKEAILMTPGKKSSDVFIWGFDYTKIQNATFPTTESVHYTNAKVVLVGDSGVGKSGLGLVLSGQSFAPTESTHGRRVWTFDEEKVKQDDKLTETRETILWDLAGQPGYRLIHQLHLSEVAVALVIFDSHSETDPFAGVYHWVRALRLAESIQVSSARIKQFLVAARVDRGGKRVSRDRIEAVMQKLGFDGFYETSAKEGLNVAVLSESIKNIIDWEALPKVTSTFLFRHIKLLLVAEKEDGRLLSTCEDLYREFLRSEKDLGKFEDLYAAFETCIKLVESQGLIRRLSFGNLVLLQPEVLDAYASALINAVIDEPDGFGSIAEEKVQTGDFYIPKDERLSNRDQEKLLLIAMIEDLLRYEIALREQGQDGPYLVFPSQSTRENPGLPDPEGKTVIFSFEGPVLNIYATLAVRLAHSGFFKRKELWKDAVTYIADAGGTCGISLRNMGEGSSELTLFFDQDANEQTRFHFEEFVEAHLLRRALSNSIRRHRIFVCSECNTVIPDYIVQSRRMRNFNWLDCPVCDQRLSLLDKKERLMAVPSSRILEMDRTADQRRDREVAKSTIQGKKESKDFDVFLCYSRKDKSEIKKFAEQLKERGILPWFDEWELPPGRPWQRLLEKQIRHIKSAAVFIGKDGIGPLRSFSRGDPYQNRKLGQQQEIEAFLREFVRRGCPVIPVILVEAPKKVELPVFLAGMTRVDFRMQDPDPMEQLLWGITEKSDMRR